VATSRSSDLVGEKTRPVVVRRASRSEEPQATLGSNTRREAPESYQLQHQHRCKKCDGMHCVGECQF
jgi:hypothetical protein